MDYIFAGELFKGLATSGTWGIFDAFNRFRAEVLSLCTVQISSILNGIKAGDDVVNIEGADLHLDHSMGIFSTITFEEHCTLHFPKACCRSFVQFR